ncbi:hypothetical protein SVAN01_09616 [Stagonosporopsis vannaccii]|nr:hypothetical protein SVAN01_09616 [Stagonosporopsis vannaccii]
MVDNKGWRKKRGDKPNELPLLKTGFEDAAAAPSTAVAPEPSDRRRHVWRKTMATSRPLTPLTPVPATPMPEEVVDTKGERSEASSPRRDSKPKITRYTSLFTSHKEESTSSIFSEQWSVDTLSDQNDPWSFVDPIFIMESIHSHMCKHYMVPIPLQYNSGLFQIFDDYRKLRADKEFQEHREREVLQHSRKITAQLFKSENLYQSEIRRLELLIARGTSGMAGLAIPLAAWLSLLIITYCRLIQARQETVVNRKRQNRKTISSDCFLHRCQHMSLIEIEEEIKAKTQLVLLHRPTSPSGKMIALSRQLTNAGTLDLAIGTPPSAKQDSVLSREVKSEFNLTDLPYTHASQPIPSAHRAGQSNTAQDTSQQVTTEAKHVEDRILEDNAFVALKELGALVARRRGLDVARFVNGVTALLAPADTPDVVTELTASDDRLQTSEIKDNFHGSGGDTTLSPSPWKTQSQSFQELSHKHRRHFSFEPGDDQLRELKTNLKMLDSLSQNNSTDSELSSSTGCHLLDNDLQTSDDDLNSRPMSLGADFPRPSMIPSPIQMVGQVRRGISMSSLKSPLNKTIRDGRHNSRTSIQTAFREASSAHVSMKLNSRNGSDHNLYAAESPLGSKDRPQSPAIRHNTAALAASRPSESRSINLSGSSTQTSIATSAPLDRHGIAQQRTENDDPITCKNSGREDAK